ncbi:hypothetical protein [Longimicrobium sp.]|uniref:hypothetical protein n=1 Tax=Longimicrobium sp. TaxID=2029185 RepID=UPI002BE47372|nr:hypothetical protein [Longimicrobium sp.]HSU14847.1 hypothetical protein [Longimicrobium sp.]
MRTQLEEAKHDEEAFVPDPEIVAVMAARGVTVKTGAFKPRDFPLRKRPAWLAFLIRLTRHLR